MPGLLPPDFAPRASTLPGRERPLKALWFRVSKGHVEVYRAL